MTKKNLLTNDIISLFPSKDKKDNCYFQFLFESIGWLKLSVLS